jgi:hypothetical protein
MLLEFAYTANSLSQYYFIKNYSDTSRVSMPSLNDPAFPRHSRQALALAKHPDREIKCSRNLHTLNVDAEPIFEGQDGEGIGKGLVEYFFITSNEKRGICLRKLVYYTEVVCIFHEKLGSRGAKLLRQLQKPDSRARLLKVRMEREIIKRTLAQSARPTSR